MNFLHTCLTFHDLFCDLFSDFIRECAKFSGNGAGQNNNGAGTFLIIENHGALTFFVKKNHGAHTFSQKKNHGAHTFCKEKNHGAHTFLEKKITGRKHF